MVKIGLEVHCYLNTRTKLFCGCSTEKITEAAENSRVCPTCLGLPGSKPSVNSAAIEAGLKIALALQCKLPKEMFFSRKTYFYPDMSKNFQITQYEIPVAAKGKMESTDENGKAFPVSITRLNLEEDPAKIEHVGGSITEAKYTLLDYNRSGLPLCEIVTAPIFKTPRQARLFLQNLEAVLRYVGAMNPAFSLKADANISIPGGERVEIKNITGYREVERALHFEIVRQNNAVRRGQKIEMETRLWDAQAKVTRTMRKKETAEDYGYIFEPDLPRFSISKNVVSALKGKLPELPREKIARFVRAGVPREIAKSIASDLELALFFEKLKSKSAPRWMLLLKKTLNYRDLSVSDITLKPEHLEPLIKAVENKSLSERAGELILRKVLMDPGKLKHLMQMDQKVGKKELEEIVRDVLRKEPKAALALRKGNKKVIEFLVGRVMKALRGRAEPKEVKSLLKKVK